LKHQVITLKKHSGNMKTKDVFDNSIFLKNHLPEGCTGILFCFESKKAARAYWGKDIDMIRFEEIKSK
jgi:hypothetical protein